MPDGVQINKVEKVVFFVYNGADFVNLKNNFKSYKFQAVVVHLPRKFCVSWKKDLEHKAYEEKIQGNKRALQEKEDALEKARQKIINLRNRLSSLSEIPNEIQ